jgi:hypothetical protein
MKCWVWGKSFPHLTFPEVCELTGEAEMKAQFAVGREIMDEQDLKQGEINPGAVEAQSQVGYDILQYWDIYTEKEFVDQFDVEMSKVGLKPNATVVNNDGHPNPVPHLCSASSRDWCSHPDTEIVP